MTRTYASRPPGKATILCHRADQNGNRGKFELVLKASLERQKKKKSKENIFLCEKFTFGDLKRILSVFFFLKSGGSLYHVIIAERMKDGKSQAS